MVLGDKSNGVKMTKYKKGKNLLTQKELKEAAKNKQYVWVVWLTPNPYDKGKQLNYAVIPESYADEDGFYLGDTAWDNVDNDEEKCFSDGYDGDTLEVYEAVLKINKEKRNVAKPKSSK